jgi:stage IV sporulation protein FB
MRHSAYWSANLGRWGNTHVRLHVLMFGVLFVLLLLSIRPDGSLAWQGVALALVLVASAALHELAHVLTALRLGGRVEGVILGPLGGLEQIEGASRPRGQFLIAAAGPLANAAVCLAILPVLISAGRLEPVLVETGLARGGPAGQATGWVVMQMAFLVNALLVSANLLPAAPLDGGRLLRSVLWRFVGYRNAVLVTGVVGRITAIALCLAAWGLRHHPATTLYFPGGAVPLWAVLAGVGVLLYFSARCELDRLHERELSEEWLGYDFSETFTDVRGDEPQPPQRRSGLIRRWIEQRAAARDHHRQILEEEEEWRVDDILARLHEFGIESLSAEDRSILQRVSARYRSRLEGKS